jgi:hypothetical protein
VAALSSCLIFLGAFLVLLLKLLLTPLFILVVTLIGRRWGSLVSGWLVGLPLTSAPVMLFIAIEQGAAFASRAALGTMTGTISVALFCLAYSWLSLRFNWYICLLTSWVVFFVSTYLLEPISLNLFVSFVSVLLILAVVIAALPKDQKSGPITTPPRWEITARMLVATLFVLILTESAALLGPRLSGLLTPFPLFASIVGAFTHALQGAPAVRRVLRGVLAGAFAFTLFFFTISGLIEHVGIVGAFALALFGAMLVQGSSLWILQKHSAFT